MENRMYIWTSSWNSIGCDSVEEAVKIIKETEAYSISSGGVSKSTEDFIKDLNFEG